VSAFYDNMINPLFRKLGANDKETKAYLKLLEIGANPVSSLAKLLNIPRSTMYLTLDHLKDLQLVDHFERNGIKYVKAIQPKEIISLLESKENEIIQTKKDFQSHLQELESLTSRLSITPTVVFFEGKDSTMRLYEEILSKESFDAFFNPEIVKAAMPEYHYKIGETIEEGHKHVRELLINCPDAIEYKEKFENEKHKIKILPEGTAFTSDTIITNDTIYMISYSDKDISATKIVNTSLASTQRQMFELLWANI
jgi:sugar-specific transcriptional regulator TrmB